MSSVYRQFTDQIAIDAARSAPVDSHSSAFKWLDGDWMGCGEPVRFALASYGISIQTAKEGPKPFLIYRSEAEMWVLVLSDPSAFGVLVGLPPNRGEVRFTGEISLNGQTVRLRQTWHLLDDAVEIEEDLMENRRWRPSGTRCLERVKMANAHAAP